MTREQWLQLALKKLAPLFREAGHDISDLNIQVSVGFPSRRALGAKRRTIGQCWPPEAAADGSAQIFISPVLDEPVKVLGVLVHEIVHAVVGCEHKHKAPFAKVAKQMGLTGKMTATEESPELVEKLKAILAKMDSYPHGALLVAAVTKDKQTTRLLKVVCPSGCSSEDKVYTVRVTKVHLEAYGPPICPGCEKRMVDENGEAVEPETEAGE
jgi:hypothetical protein